ncbi:MAG: DEAD/DEAH box helicase family protein [Planctomycetota bacterium]|jgi:superfamily II DNA or RNA helicase|nr:DEAD/DEAH box helicase family protein [Planctomycetota bacterium]MDP7134279.1 DEAD/DEAH box helicase family protein [Planctomycetota bacterium]
MIKLEFDRGSILVHADGEPDGFHLPGCVFDERVDLWRAPARFYREIVTVLTRSKTPFEDTAREYEELQLASSLERKPFPYQQEAVDTWAKSGKRGVVVLPTGAGKTFVAQMIMGSIQRSTLVVTPTIDLMQQWYGVLGTGFDMEVGLIGGGYYEPRPVTVTTYDSAYIHMERIGNRFGLIVFDECHHLPGPTYLMAAEACIAPFRLGLTATPDRDDGEEWRLQEAIGPIAYRKEIKELAGDYLSDYETVRVYVRLSDEEREEYTSERAIYRDFLRMENISLSGPNGWTRFLMATSRSEQGRRAFLAYRNQKSIAQASGAKIRELEDLLARHRFDRVIIFTSDNKTVYKISRKFLIPAITHQTKVKERHEILQRFNAGDYPFLVTSKVLNEGVDVPAANVAIVLSGSGSVREHVQRLGRILRRAQDKHALLYEVVAEDTAEEYVSSRRRQHSAYS